MDPRGCSLGFSGHLSEEAGGRLRPHVLRPPFPLSVMWWVPRDEARASRSQEDGAGGPPAAQGSHLGEGGPNRRSVGLSAHQTNGQQEGPWHAQAKDQPTSLHQLHHHPPAFPKEGVQPAPVQPCPGPLVGSWPGVLGEATLPHY